MSKFIALIIAIISYPIIYYLSAFYTGGDQYLYSLFYQEVKDLDLVSAYRQMQVTLGAGEPLYCIMVWVAANFFSKIIFFSVLNSLVVYYYSLLILRSCVYKYFIPLFLTNYYLFFLLFGTERNKVSFLFILIFIAVRNKIIKGGSVLLSLSSHFSSVMFFLIPYISSLLELLVSGKFYSLRIKKINFYLSIILGGGGLFFIFLIKDSIVAKLMFYSSQIFYIESAKVLVLILVSIFSVRREDRVQVNVVLVLYALLALFVGGGRFFLISFLTLTYYVLRARKISLTYVFLLIYLSCKSYTFILNMIEYGDPFYFVQMSI